MGFLADWSRNGITVGPAEYDISVVRVEIDGVNATVITCNLDGVSLLAASGEVYIPADEFRYERFTELQLLPQGRRVVKTGFVGEGKTICEI